MTYIQLPTNMTSSMAVAEKHAAALIDVSATLVAMAVTENDPGAVERLDAADRAVLDAVDFLRSLR